MNDDTNHSGAEHGAPSATPLPGSWSVERCSASCLAVVVLVVLATHVVGRVSAICASANYDSFTYAVCAYRFFSPDASAADLVPDKPAGQFMMTGWCYRVWPGPPSRLVLAPIESAFLLAAYAAFWFLARGMHGAHVAGVQTILLVFALNAYNTLDDSSAGFNVNENYLLLPMLIAVTAHVAMSAGWRRGLVRGLGLGLALSIKQTAGGVLLAMLVHGIYRAWRSGRWREAAVSACWTAGGAVLAVSPLVAVLAVRGWLVPHAHDLAGLSGGHLELPRLKPPPWLRLAPLVPIAWWMLAGVAAWRAGCSDKRFMAAGGEVGEKDGRSVGAFLWLWLGAEMTVLALLNRHSAHYYQPLVVPASLLAGAGVAWALQAGYRLPGIERARLWRWSFLVTLALMLPALMSFIVETQRRWAAYDVNQETVAFVRRLASGVR